MASRASTFLSLAVIAALFAAVLYQRSTPAVKRFQATNAKPVRHTVLKPAAASEAILLVSASNQAERRPQIDAGAPALSEEQPKTEPQPTKADPNAPALPKEAPKVQQQTPVAAPPTAAGEDAPATLGTVPTLRTAQIETDSSKPATTALPPNTPQVEKAKPAALVWHTDYDLAMNRAKASGKMLFIFFHDPNKSASRRAFENESLANPEVKERLRHFVLAKLPRTARLRVGGRWISILGHPAFSEMLNRQGIAIVDYAHPGKSYYGHVVSTFPFTSGMYYRTAALKIILDLPAGTLTQRTMVYAVRIHPSRPASAYGKLSNVLAHEAQKHSHYQANITLQGHHAWESRFHQINSQLPGGMMAQEVVAESWPNESLVEACVDCVHSWEQSPGHWGAVRSRQPLFGYDIKRGRNGIWYATGIFGRW